MPETDRPSRPALADPDRLAALSSYGAPSAVPELLLESLVRLAAELHRTGMAKSAASDLSLTAGIKA